MSFGGRGLMASALFAWGLRMSTAYAVTGNSVLSQSAQGVASGDSTGGPQLSETTNISFAATGGTAPTMDGWLNGNLVAAAGDILLAHATDPLGAMGDSTYSPPGYAVAGKKIKEIRFKNNDSTQSVTIISKASVGAPIFAALGDGIVLLPGASYYMNWPAGTAAMTTGANDALTLAVTGGTPDVEITVRYGS